MTRSKLRRVVLEVLKENGIVPPPGETVSIRKHKHPYYENTYQIVVSWRRVIHIMIMEDD